MPRLYCHVCLNCNRKGQTRESPFKSVLRVTRKAPKPNPGLPGTTRPPPSPSSAARASVGASTRVGDGCGRLPLSVPCPIAVPVHPLRVPPLRRWAPFHWLLRFPGPLCYACLVGVLSNKTRQRTLHAAFLEPMLLVTLFAPPEQLSAAAALGEGAGPGSRLAVRVVLQATSDAL